MAERLMSILAKETDGESYSAHKYGLDHAERPYIDYGEDSNIWKATAETTHHRDYVSVDSYLKKLNESGYQLFSYFLDGSRRVFKVDDIAFRQRRGIYPVIAGQIGVGCMRRHDRKLTCEKFKQEFVLSVPDIADFDGRSGFFPAIAQKLNKRLEEFPALRDSCVRFSAILPYDTSKNAEKNFEDKGTAKIQDRMIEQEKDMVAQLVREEKLDQNNYLIKDGSLEYRPTKEDRKDKRRCQRFQQNYNRVLGVSKSFNPEVCLDIHGKPNPRFIAKLPLYHRTPVACFTNPNLFGDMKFAVWYVRIRDSSRTRTLFDGILKIEKMLVTSEELEYGIDSELVDVLTANIIKERSPTCYASDMRWANHLYPVYLTESFVKSKYLSTESFLQLF